MSCEFQFNSQFLKMFITAMITVLIVWGRTEQATVAADGESSRVELVDVIWMMEPGPVHLRFRIAIQGRSLTEQRLGYLKRLYARFDQNGDGKLTLDETAGTTVWKRGLGSRSRRFLQNRQLTARPVTSEVDIETLFQEIAGEPVVFRQNNTDTTHDDFLFDFLDHDQSGVIDEHEIGTASRRLSTRDFDRDKSVGLDELQAPPSDLELQGPAGLGAPALPDMAHSRFSEDFRLSNDPTVPESMIRRYDRNGDGRLSASELNWTAEHIAPSDGNRDGQLSRSELAHLDQSPFDLELIVNLEPMGAPSHLRIVQSSGAQLDPQQRPDLVSVELQKTVVVFSCHGSDPVQRSIDNAQRKFNSLDADVNGYLDLDEVQSEPLLQRELFDQIDFDRDSRMSIGEISDYVSERAAAKSISCRVEIMEAGRGFFSAMDINADGRLSQRELRSTAPSLQRLALNEVPGISRDEPRRRYRIEFTQGTYMMFGPNEQFDPRLAAYVVSSAVGPAWFVASDQNNDGDLTWDEFLGHRADFRRLDVDGDALIDAVEAQQAAVE